MDGLDRVWEWLFQKLGHELAPFVLGILGFVAYAFLRLIWRQFRKFLCFVSSRRRALRAVARQYSKDGPREGMGLWVTKPINAPENYENNLGKPIVLAVANHKGGVGKTTIAANLGAFWAQEWDKSVLLIDLDFQGSLSSMAMRGGDWLPPRGQDSLATRAISGDLEPSIFVACAKEVPQQPRLHVITAYYDLAQADNRLIIEWLLRCKSARYVRILSALRDILFGNSFKTADVRYTLAELLQSPAVRREYQVVIIDCPPRLTTSAVQGLCASSHLLIPTILDLPSAEAVLAFCEEIEGLKKAQVCPHLEYVGIVGTKVSPSVDRIAERDAKNLIRDRLADMHNPTGLLDDSEFIRHSTALINDADDGIAYLVMSNAERGREVKQLIRRFATYVAGQIGLPPPQAHITATRSGNGGRL